MNLLYKVLIALAFFGVLNALFSPKPKAVAAAATAPTIIDPWKQATPAATAPAPARGPWDDYAAAPAAAPPDASDIDFSDPYQDVSADPAPLPSDAFAQQAQVFEPMQPLRRTSSLDSDVDARAPVRDLYEIMPPPQPYQPPAPPVYVDRRGREVFGAVSTGPNSYVDPASGENRTTFDRGDGVQQTFRRPIDAYNEAGRAFEDN